MKMLTCKKCATQFPSATVIDGKRRNLSCRRYCLNCSPWGKSNSRRLNLYDGDNKLCADCGHWKPLTDFYVSSKGYPSGYCRSCYSVNYRGQYKNMKERAVAYKGGVCQDCTRKFPSCVFDFHHLDPTQKDMKLGGNFKKHDWEDLTVELDKCVLLCANCHRIRHHDPF
jgi:hypothetical protein